MTPPFFLPKLDSRIANDPKVRELLLRVFDGEPRTLPHLHRMVNLHRRIEVLEWLITNRLTGKNFIGWLRDEHQGDLTAAVCGVLRRCNAELLPTLLPPTDEPLS